MGWTTTDIPDQAGRIFIVTGGNSGLGFETARALAGHGAHVVLACRDLDKAAEASALIEREHPGAKTETRELDLASLESVRRFADDCARAHPRIDGLLNNAGVMALPRRETADGFEMQLGTNHLGHFALTGLLLDRLIDNPGARIVTVSSQFHRLGRIDFDDLQSQKRYSKWMAYARSKLANLLFAAELQRRLAASGSQTTSLCAHPGYAATNLQTAGPRMEGNSLMERGSELANRIFAQSADAGALPSLYAATAAEARGGDYIGPDGIGEMRGQPRVVTPSARARDPQLARRLWEVSESLTGVTYRQLANV